MLIQKESFRQTFETIKKLARNTTIQLFVAPDSDAICSTHLLTQLLKQDDLIFNVMPVGSHNDLLSIYRKLKETQETVVYVLINCGGIVSINGFLEPTEDEKFFVIDCHRPYHYDNVTDTEKVFLLGPESLSMIPKPPAHPEDEERRARDDDDDDDDDNDDTDGDEEFADDVFGDANDENLPASNRRSKSLAASIGAASDDDYISSSYDSQSESGTEFEDERSDSSAIGKKRRRRGFADDIASEDESEDLSEREQTGSLLSDIGDDLSSLADDTHSTSSRSDREKRKSKTRRPTKQQRDTQQKGKKTSSSEDPETYYYSTFYSRASSMALYDLAKELGRATKQLLWLTIVGFSDQMVHQRISAERLRTEFACLEQEVRQLFSSSSSATGTTSAYSSELRVQVAQDYKFMAFRHWNLYESMYHSSYVASRLGIWSSSRGRKRLDLFLAKMGLPLVQCKQEYSMMDNAFRRELGKKLAEYGPQFGLRDLCFNSFVKSQGRAQQISAIDTVYSVIGLLERIGNETSSDSSEFEKLWTSNFWRAYDSLSPSSNGAWDRAMEGIELAKTQQQMIVKMGGTLIETKKITVLGSFRYGVIDTSSTHSKVFSQPFALLKLSQFLQDTFSQMKKKAMPIVLAALDEDRGTYTLCGVAPNLTEANEFGSLFVDAAQETESEIHHTFDASIIELAKNDVKKFVESLHSASIGF